MYFIIGYPEKTLERFIQERFQRKERYALNK